MTIKGDLSSIVKGSKDNEITVDVEQIDSDNNWVFINNN